MLIQMNEQCQNNFNLLYLCKKFRAEGGRWGWLRSSVRAMEQGQHPFWLSWTYFSCYSAFSQITLNKRKWQSSVSSQQHLLSLAKAVASSESLCHLNDIRKRRIPFCLAISKNKEKLWKCTCNLTGYLFVIFQLLQLIPLFNNYKYAGDQAAEILFIRVLIWKKGASGNKKDKLKFLSSRLDSQRSEWRRHLFPSDYLRINL